MGWVECEQQRQIVNLYMSIGVIQFLKLENLLTVAGFKHTGLQCVFCVCVWLLFLKSSCRPSFPWSPVVEKDSSGVWKPFRKEGISLSLS